MRDILSLILAILLVISIIIIAWLPDTQQPEKTIVVTKYINSTVKPITPVIGHKCAVVSNFNGRIQINVMDCASIATNGPPIKVITVS